MPLPSDVVGLWKKCMQYPMGNRLFSWAFCYKAPYFSSIFPLVLELAPGKAVVQMHQRRAVQNHIGTVHAIACCNLVEMAMGCAAEATIPPHLRWLPKGMDVNYVAKAKGTLTATVDVDPETIFTLDKYPGQVDFPVVVKDAQDQDVVTATVRLHVSEKKPKAKL
mmetsp:Transcript_3199/g.11044  ORF Transcript_3199/g.11044 Transcript_3199/m.11044 type:complete len:165 (-) Transcript_3199:172-666(-)